MNLNITRGKGSFATFDSAPLRPPAPGERLTERQLNVNVNHVPRVARDQAFARDQ